jgi:hypothetical protein
MIRGDIPASPREAVRKYQLCQRELLLSYDLHGYLQQAEHSSWNALLVLFKGLK